MCEYFNLVHQLIFKVIFPINHTDDLFEFDFLHDHILTAKISTNFDINVLSHKLYDTFLKLYLLLQDNYLGNIHKLFLINSNF
jgi:hypothetical protein